MKQTLSQRQAQMRNRQKPRRGRKPNTGRYAKWRIRVIQSCAYELLKRGHDHLFVGNYIRNKFTDGSCPLQDVIDLVRAWDKRFLSGR